MSKEIITHSLERTSPKGGLFLGRCVHCGMKNLTSSAAFEKCPNPEGISSDEAVVRAVEGNAG